MTSSQFTLARIPSALFVTRRRARPSGFALPRDPAAGASFCKPLMRLNEIDGGGNASRNQHRESRVRLMGGVAQTSRASLSTGKVVGAKPTAPRTRRGADNEALAHAYLCDGLTTRPVDTYLASNRPIRGGGSRLLMEQNHSSTRLFVRVASLREQANFRFPRLALGGNTSQGLFCDPYALQGAGRDVSKSFHRHSFSVSNPLTRSVLWSFAYSPNFCRRT